MSAKYKTKLSDILPCKDLNRLKDVSMYGQTAILQALSLNNLVFHFCNFCSKNGFTAVCAQTQDYTGLLESGFQMPTKIP